MGIRFPEIFHDMITRTARQLAGLSSRIAATIRRSCSRAGGIITEDRAGLYAAEDSVSACFRFENGLTGSGSWCFAGHKSAKEDRVEIIGDKGMLCFSVFNYDPIQIVTSEGTTSVVVPNPPYVQLPLIRAVIEDLQGRGVCSCTCVSATPVNWVMDRILGKF